MYELTLQTMASSLHALPQTIWVKDSPPDWDALLASMVQRKSWQQLPTLKNMNPARKWEVVSAYQKSVRRGDLAVALKMVAAIDCTGDLELLKYLWRRVLTTVAEDCGPASPGLMAMVMAAHEWAKKEKPDHQIAVISVLTEMMCMYPRSRTYCAMSIIENRLKTTASTEGGPPAIMNLSKDPLDDWELEFFEWFRTRPDEVEQTVAWWCKKKGWLTEHLSDYYSFTPELVDAPQIPFPVCEMILGLPSYAYDMHTRLGKTILYKLVGEGEVKTILTESKCNDKMKALGWAMFFCEGGRIEAEQWDLKIANLERKVAYGQFGMSSEEGLGLEAAMQLMIDSGKVNARRTYLGRQMYG
ncbi:hypothetical protein DLP3_078 [Stenotrophomonas phage vB_SmaS_DLP_3]|nr:hypothetical protein DLP3_078 [Stenotrophomonas phage vB_SmaS_DLP_3]